MPVTVTSPATCDGVLTGTVKQATTAGESRRQKKRIPIRAMFKSPLPFSRRAHNLHFLIMLSVPGPEVIALYLPTRFGGREVPTDGGRASGGLTSGPPPKT